MVYGGTETMIEMIDVYKSFGTNHVLRGVNLKVEAGESMVVIGGGGTGKSVILKHIIGLMKPDSGRIVMDGQDLADLSEEEINDFRKRFGMLFQGAALFDSLSVLENVGFGWKEHTDRSDDEVREIVRKRLEMVGLRGVEDQMAAALSGGRKNSS